MKTNEELNKQLIEAAKDGNSETVKTLLDNGADLLAQEDLALRGAAENGHTETVKLLLDNGADVHAQEDKALRLAAENGHTETVQVLKNHVEEIENKIPQKTSKSIYFEPSKGFFANLSINYERFSKTEVCDELNKLGVKNISEETAKELIQGKKTSELVDTKIWAADQNINVRARIQLSREKDGQVKSKLLTVKDKVDFTEYHGHKFTEEEVNNLKTTGQAGNIIYADYEKNGQKTPVLLSFDKTTNRLFAVRTDDIKIPQPFIGAELTDLQRSNLLAGKAVRIENMIGKKGVEFSATVQYNADKRNFDITFDKLKQFSSLSMKDSVAGVKLSKEQQTALQNNEVVKVENMVDKKGQPFSAYVKYQNHKFVFGKTKDDPKFIKSIIPKQEHKEQVGVNNDGAGNLNKTVKTGETIQEKKKIANIKTQNKLNFK